MGATCDLHVACLYRLSDGFSVAVDYRVFEGKEMAIDSLAETTAAAFRVDHLIIALAMRDMRDVNEPRIFDVSK